MWFENKGKDRRDFLRMGVQAAVRFGDADGSLDRRGTTRNLSATGILFETAEPPVADELLSVEVAGASDAVPPLTARLRVIRVDEESPGLFVVAGELLDVR